MSLLKPWFLLALLLPCALCMSSAARGQITNVNNSTSTPIPGAGHDYIHSLVETVNPSNGSLSLRITIPVPTSRQLTVPYAITYDSNGVHVPSSIVNTNGSGSLGWSGCNGLVHPCGGWNDTFPKLSKISITHSTGVPQYPYCTFSSAYVFSDPEGGRHSLGIDHVPNNTACSNYSGLQNIPTGGDDLYRANLVPNWPDDGSGTVYVTSADGTVYKFSDTAAQKGITTPYIAQASTIEDRNGNILSLTFGTNTYTITDTAGRAVLTFASPSSSTETITVLGLSQPYTETSNNVPFSFTLASTLVNSSQTNCYSSLPATSGSNPIISTLSLPNGQQFQFSYESTYGLLSKVVYPTGGYVSYTWRTNPQSELGALVGKNGGAGLCSYIYDMYAVAHRYVSFDGVNIALQQDFNYSTTWPTNPQGWTSKQTTITTHDLIRGTSFQTIYTYSPVTVAEAPYVSDVYAQFVPVETTIVSKDTSGNVLQTVTKTWQDQYLLTDETTQLGSGSNAPTADAHYTYYPQAHGFQLQEKDEYDFGPGAKGPLLRKSIYNYASFPATPIFPSSPSIFDRPSSIITYDGNNNRVAESDYAYDQASVASVNNLPTGTHDETNYSGSSTAPRGNATTITRQCFVGSTNCTNPVTKYTYDETGQVLSLIDPCGNATCSDISDTNHTTTYSYADDFDSPPSSNTNAYLTRITRPTTSSGAAHVQTFKYAYADGQLIASTDENGQTAQYLYNDSLRRLTEADYPDGGKTTIAYSDVPYNPSTPSPSVTTTEVATPSPNLITLKAFDGLGHTARSVLTSDPDCASGDRTDTTFDGLGRVYTVSNPYCTTSDPTYGLTTSAYDALGRTTQVTHPDGSTILTSYTGRATQVQDEGNGTQRVTRISQVDGLGRLTSVCEVAPGPFVGGGGASSSTLIGSGGTPAACGQDIAGSGFLTTYQYDALDNLLQVNQSGIVARTFAYDSLSRVTGATNPESGTVSYAYDANGNLIRKTDGRNITTTYSADALNRLTGKTYSDGTPAATLNYDQTSALGVTLTNTIGRKSSEGTAGSLPTGSVFSYNSMGRIADNSQCTPQNCGTGVFSFQYPQYDFLGDLISGTNAAGVTFTHSYNGAARLTGITTNFVDASHPGTLFSSAHYAPFGPLTSSTLGNSLNESFSYDKRLREQSYSATSGSTTRFSFNITSFASNGDILAANDSVNGNWTCSYDPFNRLVGSNQNSRQAVYSYVYDRFGNRWQQNGPHPMQLTFTGNNPSNPQNNNRMDGYSYDLAGNLLNDGTHSYSYDAENRLIKVDNGTTANYVYDAEGRRVRKTTASGTLDFLYDTHGHKVAEVDPTGTFQRGELYAGDRHFAVYAPDPGSSGATFFIHADWLGTERARTNMTGTTCETITSLPFGDGQTISDTCGDSAGDVSPMHFTGKERDTETGLDNFGARYDSSSFGRFMSPDPVFVHVLRVVDPQRLNLYAYARNNPLVFLDPTGKDIVSGTGDQKAVKAALVEIARHPGGREFLTKLDNLSAQIKVSTGTGLTDRNGNPVYGKTGVQLGSDPHINRVTDSSGKIVDVKSPNIETTVDFGLAKQDRNNGIPDAPKSDAELLGHELKHDEFEFFKLPNTEEGATQGIDDILNTKPTKESKQGAEEFVDNLLKPNSQNQNNQQQPTPPPPPKCSGDNKQNCSN